MSKVCDEELNAQLQALGARVKQLEVGLESSLIGQMWNFFKTVAALTAGTYTAPVAAAILADPFAKMCFDMMTAGGANVKDIKDLYDLSRTLTSIDYKKILLQLALENLGHQPYLNDLVNDVTTDIQSAINAKSAELAAAIAANLSSSEIQKLMDDLNDLNDTAASIVGMVNASNNASVCKIASSLVGLK
jgi:hypothetical protein